MGFTLLEVLIAAFIITVGIMGVFTVINKSVSQMAASPSHLIAAYLTQEGIEIVRNIRDTNWIEPTSVSWDDGLKVAGDYRADYNDSSLTSFTSFPPGGRGYYLNIDNNGYYSYEVADNPTIFQRKITISQGPIPADSLKVFIDVWWTEKGTENHVTAQELLYNWH